ncbi:hypothetical protein V8F20_009820 [Naviculisporaceae sp. PSN 640]
MLPFRATPAIPTMRAVVGTGVGLFPRPVVSSTTSAAAILCTTNQRHNFFLPALQQRFASLGSGPGSTGANFVSPSTPGGQAGKPRQRGTTSASRAIDEMEIIDPDIHISDPPEAVGASNAATARAYKEARHGKGKIEDDIDGNTMLYASAGALGLLGLYAVFKENPTTSGPSSSSSIGGSGSGGIKTRSTNELDPGTDARGRTSPLSSIKSSSRQHHDLPAHAPGGETLEFKLGRG